MPIHAERASGESDRLQDRLLVAVGDRTFRRIGELTNTHPETVRRVPVGPCAQRGVHHPPGRGFGLNLNWILTGRGPMRVAEIKPPRPA
ncbi:MAG: hypothetical protein KatS3mg103_0954 [Phycisphaerales bacterium]|nr:MAG: hypothetical protein KatS3mg103_0954 [Phycisphaerales bacterium]